MSRISSTVIACVALASACAALPVSRASAQGTPPAAGSSASADSVFARARRLVVSGNGAAGRLLVDSVVAAAEPDSPAYADALYWRAALAASTDDAASDYRRIVVDYPLSTHAADALLQLAQLEVARGDRASAATHLQRFLLENPKHPDRAKAGLLLAQLSFEQNDLPHGCAALHQTLADVPPDAVEMRNQLQYYLPRCSALDANPASQLPLVSPARLMPKTKADSARAAARGKYTLQIAAYESKADAAALAKKLVARGVDARVVVGAKLSRVRVGRYATRAAAVSAQTDLKAKSITALVTTTGPDDP